MSVILDAVLEFSKKLFSAKLQPIFLKLVEIHVPIASKSLSKSRVEKKKLQQILSKRYSFHIPTLICIFNFA